jgi:hypothetical protein
VILIYTELLLWNSFPVSPVEALRNVKQNRIMCVIQGIFNFLSPTSSKVFKINQGASLANVIGSSDHCGVPMAYKLQQKISRSSQIFTNFNNQITFNVGLFAPNLLP